jgi:hypothetical protein
VGGVPLPSIRLPFGEATPWGLVAARGDTLVFNARRADAETASVAVLVIVGTDTLRLGSVTNPIAPADYGCVQVRAIEQEFAPVPTWAFARHGLHVTRQTSYEIQTFEHGELRRILRRPIAGRPPTLEDLERRYPDGRTLRIDGSCRTDAAGIASAQGMAEKLPVIGRLAIAPDQSLWVEHFDAGDRPHRVDVFDSSGTYVGTLTGWGAPVAFLSETLAVFRVQDSMRILDRLAFVQINRLP